MAEMPFDVIRDHMLNDFDEPLEPDNATEHAMDIDQELQKKFLFIPFKEIEETVIHVKGKGEALVAGSGPEECNATGTENPEWLYNHAMNALALWWTLKERDAKEQEAAKLKLRPEPGWYGMQSGTGPFHPCWVTEDRRIYLMTVNAMLEDRTEVFDNLLDKSAWRFKRLTEALLQVNLTP